MRRAVALNCMRCGRSYPLTPLRFQCESCRLEAPSNLTVGYEDGKAADSVATAYRPGRGMWRYGHKLPVDPKDAVSMGEGDTPLVPLEGIASKLGMERLYGKGEWANPTGSFKDRLASMAVSSAKAIYGAGIIATSSSGNAGAAAAAYAARAGLPCIVFCFGKTTPAMLAQMRAAGAFVAIVADKAHRWRLLSQGVERHGWFPTSPFFGPAVGSNPFGLEGYKSIAYELYDQLGGEAPDWIVLPVCYGDALYGVMKGFEELRELGLTSRTPRLVGAELFGSLSSALGAGGDKLPDMPKDRDTIAFSIGASQGTYQSIAAIRETNGWAVTVSDDALLKWHGQLARTEGIYLETSSAASLAAVESLLQAGHVKPEESVVCLMTASGMKDAVSVFGDERPSPLVPPDLDEAIRVIESHYDHPLI